MALRILTLILSLFLVAASTAQQPIDEEFVIGAGDVISFDVYNEKDLFVRARVSSSGDVRIPLIGNINVLHKTTKQISKEVEAALLDGYLVEPHVLVSIEKFRPIFVKGAVKLPGAYDFQLNLTVNQAIAIAGGLRDRASSSDWFISRGAKTEKKKVKADHILQPGDVLHIKESIF